MSNALRTRLDTLEAVAAGLADEIAKVRDELDGPQATTPKAPAPKAEAPKATPKADERMATFAQVMRVKRLTGSDERIVLDGLTYEAMSKAISQLEAGQTVKFVTDAKVTGHVKTKDGRRGKAMYTAHKPTLTTFKATPERIARVTGGTTPKAA